MYETCSKLAIKIPEQHFYELLTDFTLVLKDRNNGRGATSVNYFE